MKIVRNAITLCGAGALVAVAACSSGNGSSSAAGDNVAGSSAASSAGSSSGGLSILDVAAQSGPLAEVGLAGGSDLKPLGSDEGEDTDDAREHSDESTSGWTPDRRDAVHLGTPKRNPVIARSVGEPL